MKNNRWQANVDAANVSSNTLLEAFAPDKYKTLEFDNIDAAAALSGNILPFINRQTNVGVNVDRVTASSGEQNLTAQGSLVLADIATKPDIAETNLDVTANLDFDRLPIDGVVASATKNNQLVNR